MDFSAPRGGEPLSGIDLLLDGWRSFGNGWLLLDMFVVLMLVTYWPPLSLALPKALGF